MPSDPGLTVGKAVIAGFLWIALPALVLIAVGFYGVIDLFTWLGWPGAMSSPRRLRLHHPRRRPGLALVVSECSAMAALGARTGR